MKYSNYTQEKKYLKDLYNMWFQKPTCSFTTHTNDHKIFVRVFYSI